MPNFILNEPSFCNILAPNDIYLFMLLVNLDKKICIRLFFISLRIPHIWLHEEGNFTILANGHPESQFGKFVALQILND